MQAEWQYIQFEDGSDTYVCKTEKEFLTLRIAYADRITRIKPGVWRVANKDTKEKKTI